MSGAGYKIKIFEERCTGCRACELACSFHHSHAFSRKMSALEVIRSESDWHISITRYVKDEHGHIACDYCSGEDQPLCVKYCASGAIVEV